MLIITTDCKHRFTYLAFTYNVCACVFFKDLSKSFLTTEDPTGIFVGCYRYGSCSCLVFKAYPDSECNIKNLKLLTLPSLLHFLDNFVLYI